MDRTLIKVKDVDCKLIYKDIKDIIDISDILKRVVLSSEVKSLGSSVRFKLIEGNKIAIKKSFDSDVLAFLVENIEHFTEREIDYLSDYFETHNKRDVVIFHIIELMLLLKLFKRKIITLESLYAYSIKLNYVPNEFFDCIKTHLGKVSRFKKSGFRKNTNILKTNKNNYEFPRDLKSLRHKEIKELLLLLDLPMVELPQNKDNDNTVKFLRMIYQLKSSLKLKRFNFSLRVKKLHNKKLGMFIVNANTVIVDPRHPNVFIHELGHYIYENNLAFSFNEKRYYPSIFKNNIKKFKKENVVKIEKSEIEDYSDDSEVFALFFEKLLVNYDIRNV